jgi:hypothetical protein
VADAPRFADLAVPVEGTMDPGVVTHVLGLPDDQLAYGGPPSRALVTNGVRVMRTGDSGCTWQRVYSIDPRDTTAAAGDPQVVAGQVDPEYTVRSVAARWIAPGARPVTGSDPVYAVLSNSDGLYTGVAVNALSQPYYVARSLDGGRTWHTDLLQAKLEGAPAATPVTGDGTSPRVVVSPADPRTAYLLLDTRDPRSLDPDRPGTMRALYVTRDAGATWSYGTRQDPYVTVTPDPVDPRVVYSGSATGKIEAVTLGATVTRRTLFQVPVTAVQALDVVRPPHRPAMLLVTSTYYDDKAKVWRVVLFRSVDGGRAWLRIELDGVADFSGLGGALVGSAWLTASGDVVAMRSIGGTAAPTLLSYRWDGRRRAWRKPVVERPPTSPGFAGFGISWFGPLDSAHRRFAFRGSESAGPSTSRDVVGVYDSGG